MNTETKQRKWKQFKSGDMGDESYASMIFFGNNILFMDRLLLLEGAFLAELERGMRGPEIPPHQRLKIVQVGQMDALSKIMIMMESMFVTIDVFRDDKKKLAKKLREYKQNVVWKVVNEILDGQFSTTDYWKIMGFPEPQKLGLAAQELALIKKMLDGVLEEFAETIVWLATFYEQHSRLYNNFKHGLSIRFGYRRSVGETGAPRSLIIAFDKPSQGKKRTIIPVHRPMPIPQPIIVSKSDNSVWDRYSKAMSYTRRVVLFLAKNNMVRLQNCGENFIPYDYDVEGIREYLHFPKTLTDDEIKRLEPILLELEKQTLFLEDKVLDYGTLDGITSMNVARRLTNEDVVRVE